MLCGAYLAGFPIAFGYGIIYFSLLGAILALAGVSVVIAILIVRKRRTIKYKKMVFSF
jgi:DHA1 family arabinose polymer transporter-like MFS transporter